MLCIFSCKKNLSEPEMVIKIKETVSQKNINKENFAKTIFPLVQELYKRDSVKYNMINHIAKKANIQNDKAIYKINLDNLKDELKYIK